MTELSDALAKAKADADASYATAAATPGQATTDAAAPIWWSTQSAMTMSAAVLIFGVVVLILATYTMRSGKTGMSVLRIYGTILVIVMTTFLVVAGYTNDQIAAPLGLLGTIAGYLLGKETGTTTAPVEHKAPPDGGPPNPAA